MTDIEEQEIIAAIDLGSNSFHMIVAKIDQGQLVIIDRLREMVRLGAGLKSDGGLDDSVKKRALDCLSRFGQRLQDMSHHDIRAVGTNTMRQINDEGNFLLEAENALGHPIEIINGREEARLVYLGVAHGFANPDKKRLVIDIGGGSTEFILGKGLKPKQRESLYMGCVNTGMRYFANGEITQDNMRYAIIRSRIELRPIKHLFNAKHWHEAVGSSGSIKSIQKVALANGWSENGITSDSLKKIRKALINFGHVDNIKLEGLSEERRPVFVGGVAVLSAAFKALDIEQMQVSSLALREGALYELAALNNKGDTREQTVEAIQKRFNVDKDQATRVKKTALELFRQTQESWQLNSTLHAKVLEWAATLHEVGLSLSHNGFQKHSAYILANADLPGFSRYQQQTLATLVRTHRRKFNKSAFSNLPKNTICSSQRLSILLRLATLLHRGHSNSSKPNLLLTVDKHHLVLRFPKNWLDKHPLTETELDNEAKILHEAGYELNYK